MSKRLLTYIARWQLSGFIMLVPYYTMIWFGITNPTINMIVASFIGSLFFYQIDKRIFK